MEFFYVLDAKIETNLWPFGELSSSVTVLHPVPMPLVAEERLLRSKHLLDVLVTENRAEILFFLQNFSAEVQRISFLPLSLNEFEQQLQCRNLEQ